MKPLTSLQMQFEWLTRATTDIEMGLETDIDGGASSKSTSLAKREGVLKFVAWTSTSAQILCLGVRKSPTCHLLEYLLM